MHTVRNRIASRTSIAKAELAITKPALIIAKAGLAEFKPPVQRASREELRLIARSRVLAEGSAMQSSMAPERASERPPAKRRNLKGKKARKAAARKADSAAAKTVGAARIAAGAEGKARGNKRSKSKPPAPLIAPSALPPLHPLSELGSGPLLDLCLQAEPALALLLPLLAEPLVKAPAQVSRLAKDPEPATVRVLTFASMPELLEQPPETALELDTALVLTLPDGLAPSALEPGQLGPADTHAAPLPRSRALVRARRQGLVDVIAFLLRDSGRRLARWSARRHKSKAERETLRRAEARQRALVSELDALDALLRSRG